MSELPVQDTDRPKMWERSSALRILRHPLSGLGIGIGDKLQQAWWCRETDEIEWRDVEIIMTPLSGTEK